MLNYETLLSSYDDRLTLMQWLKKVEEALKNASAISFDVNKRGDATLTFSIKFEDGSEIESGPFTLEQGESVESAYISNGNLHLVLTNGDDLNAGNMFNGNITLNGSLTAASVKTPLLTSDAAEISAQKPVVEVMTGYDYFGGEYVTFSNLNVLYAGAVKNGNKLTLSLFFKITRQSGESYGSLGRFKIPGSVWDLLVPNAFDGFNILDIKKVQAFNSISTSVEFPVRIQKDYNAALQHNLNFYLSYGAPLEIGTEYLARIEVTFLLSENLAA